MTAKIINAFGRKAEDAPEVEGPIVDERSVMLLEEMIKWTKQGDLKFVGLVGISGSAAASVLQFHGASLSDIAILNLAVDALKDQIRARAQTGSETQYVEVQPPAETPDDGGESA